MDYAAAGVDVEAGDRAVELMASAVKATHGAEVMSGAGGFAGLFDGSAFLGMKRPILATSTDGVGTKVDIARSMDIHHTIGHDLVGMVVDDLVVSGARPLFMTDYIACGKLVPERIADIVRGIAEGCALTGTALVGGETAEHPGLMAHDEYDIAGAATGVVDFDNIRGPERVEQGDVVIALEASGIHSNGYSLVRRIVADAGWTYDQTIPEFGRTLGEELLEPTRLYTKLCLELLDDVHAYAHITGGGLAANLARSMPHGALAVVDRSTIAPLPVFQVLMDVAGVTSDAGEDTFNMGVGMIAVVPPAAATRVIEKSTAAGIKAWQIGEIQSASAAPTGARVISGTKGVDGGAVAMVGTYA